MRDLLRTNWTIEPLLAALRDFRRVDDGTDLLAFRVAATGRQRSVYVYLYGGDPDLINFDLEDESVETEEWDHAVERGSVGTIDDLRAIVIRWLNG
jgi:hypothetical protein